MFVPFLIMFREGLEAALIVSLIASYLKRTQRGQWLGAMWVGVIAAAALCLALGIFINETTGEFPQKQQELFEGLVAVVAVLILTYMVFWMRKVSRSVKVHLEGAIDNALASGRGQSWALIAMVFFAVAREGWSRCSSCWRRSSRMWASARRSARYSPGLRHGAGHDDLLGRGSSCTWRNSSNGPAC
ncbi:Ferrous iron uptake protein [Serratia odorifera]|uniref:Ferrous iron uptake protein n=1 Tax=Serratia odorifera TaxID=618 RepID=A0A447KW04_SEROD|nr:Ferrous iron uptake protein [Serratia odorifera]